MRQARVRAPELHGAGGWTGTDVPLTLRGLRGRFVLLDFWTSCCVNCLHVLDELRPLEERFADVLVVVGVHSPKFPHETQARTVRAAVERYGVPHPVLDDPDLRTWSQYAVRAWPTLVLVDPEGYVVHTASGEGHGPALARLLDELVAEHDARGTLQRGGRPGTPPVRAPGGPTGLRFPGGVLALPDGRLLVSDTGSHTLAVLDRTGEEVLQRVGTGERGLRDGAQPRFAEPRGLCLLPDGRVLVADTGNSALRAVELATGAVQTVAGTGARWRRGDPTEGPGREVPLSSPWDVCVWHGYVVVAMAGIHQLWTYDPGSGRLAVLAETTAEGLRDGEAVTAHLAQPSGLAAGRDRLWFVDAETSALRWYRDGQIGTALGTGLFDFGHRDGAAADALLQHPLGVCLLPDQSVAVLDTYNGAVRRYDPVTEQVTTLAAGLAEPSAALLSGDGLMVVASAASRLQRVPLPGRDADRAAVSPTELPPGPVGLDVAFQPPPGQRLDEREGPATRLGVTAAPPELLLAGAGTSPGLARTLVLAPAGQGVLRVSAVAAVCQTGGRHPVCSAHRRDWEIPVRIATGARDRLRLVLGGSDRPGAA